MHVFTLKFCKKKSMYVCMHIFFFKVPAMLSDWMTCKYVWMYVYCRSFSVVRRRDWGCGWAQYPPTWSSSTHPPRPYTEPAKIVSTTYILHIIIHVYTCNCKLLMYVCVRRVRVFFREQNSPAKSAEHRGAERSWGGHGPVLVGRHTVTYRHAWIHTFIL